MRVSRISEVFKNLGKESKPFASMLIILAVLYREAQKGDPELAASPRLFRNCSSAPVVSSSDEEREDIFGLPFSSENST